jgi:hypothetical protein
MSLHTANYACSTPRKEHSAPTEQNAGSGPQPDRTKDIFKIYIIYVVEKKIKLETSVVAAH